jgi:DNA replication and repair protein RecF
VHLRNLKLADFRNFASGAVGAAQIVEFGPRFTVLHGHNGAGKTNVLEALYLVSTLRSFRTSDMRALLRRGCDHARVEVEAFDAQLGLSTHLEVRLDRTANATRRSARIDGKLLRSAVDFYGRIQAVLFTPEDLEVLRGPPGGRRQFLDRVLFARERTHIADVQAYDKLLRSRNRVLKLDAGEMPAAERARLLDTYDHGLAEVGARIWARRVELVELLRDGFAVAFTQIHAREALASGQFESGLRYVARVAEPPRPGSGSVGLVERRTALASALREHRRRDEAARRTSVGPHLDDLEVTLDGTVAGDFASQGQARALVLAFKIAELRAARERSGEAPLLLLDDVSSELDPGRSARLFESLAAEVGQCVLTTTAARHIELGSNVERRDLELSDGRILLAPGLG